MAKAYVNKRDKFIWDNSFKPEDKVPVPSTADAGKAIVVDDDGDYALDKVATDTIYFDLRVDTSDYSITVTDTDYTVAEINDLARTYTTTILLRVQYDENNIYRLFRLYRVENGVTKWNDTVSVAEDDLVTINNDLINMQNDGTVRIYRRSINNTNMHTYSTTEHVVGTWIDGKPLYEQVVSSGLSWPAQSSTLSNLSTSLNISNIKLVTYLEVLPIPLTGSSVQHVQNGARNSLFEVTVGDIVTYSDKIDFLAITRNSNASWLGASDVLFLVRYTKTTD